MKLKYLLAAGAVSLALTGCNEKTEEKAAAAAPAPTEQPAEVAKKDCSDCDTHKKAQQLPQGHPPVNQQVQAEAANPQTDAKMIEDAAKTVEASVGTFRVAELFDRKSELNGKVVSVKGEVVKVSNGIMGRSWIHMRDGSGAEGTNDIIFTSTTQTATVGDKVVATGTLAADKDFGYGYFYSAIVENSTFAMQ